MFLYKHFGSQRFLLSGYLACLADMSLEYNGCQPKDHKKNQIRLSVLTEKCVTLLTLSFLLMQSRAQGL